MGANIAKRRACSAFSRVRSPGVNIGVSHPILKVVTVHETYAIRFALCDHSSCLLYQGVPAVVESDNVSYLCSKGGVTQRASFFGVHCQRLVRDNVFASLQSCHGYRQMEVIGRRIVNHLYV
jgi:hypothetical protein